MFNETSRLHIFSSKMQGYKSTKSALQTIKYGPYCTNSLIQEESELVTFIVRRLTIEKKIKYNET